MVCPSFSSEKTIKNGTIHNGKQKHECKECNRQFVENLQNKIISQDTKDLIDKLLLEKVPLAGIARVTDVSECWLQNYVNKKYAAIEQQVNVRVKKKGH
jgi:transposase-like protein